MRVEDINSDEVGFEPSVLPTNWTWASMGDLGLVCLGKTPGKSDYRDEGCLKIIKFRDIKETGEIDWNKTDKGFVGSSPALVNTLKRLSEGDVLLTASAHMSEHIGKKATIVKGIPRRFEAAYVVGEILQVRVNEGIDAKWLLYFLKSSDGYKAIQRRVHGVHLIASRAKYIEIPIAPLSEQTRIVAEIEKQFSRLDEAVANLKRVKANLKRYKAAVLKAAVEGKLTEEWRRNHPDVEPADKLLVRILAEWRKAAGKGKYKEPVVPDTSGLPELPAGWVWASWENILSNESGAFKRGPFGSALTKSIFVSSGYKVYEQYCPINDDPSYSRYYIDANKFREMEGFSVRERDFLISCSGVTLGRITQIPNNYEPGVINQALLRVRINNRLIKDAYFLKIFRSPYFQKQIFDNSQGAAIPNVKGVGELKAIPIPLPPLDEQIAVLQVIDEKMSVIAVAEHEVNVNLRRADRLRQSILKQAFSGQLVPQDTKDEPASVLLERIRANAHVGARLAAPKTKPANQKRARQTSPLRKPGTVSTTNEFASLDAVLTAILDRMQPGKEYSRADLADPLGLSAGCWNVAIQELKRRGRVRQVGEKRGARYTLFTNTN